MMKEQTELEVYQVRVGEMAAEIERLHGIIGLHEGPAPHDGSGVSEPGSLRLLSAAITADKAATLSPPSRPPSAG